MTLNKTISGFSSSGFNSPDDRITADDQYINVRDLQAFWQYFNTLIAWRAKAPSVTRSTQSDNGVAVGWYGWIPTLHTRDGGTHFIGPITVYLPPATQNVVLRIYGHSEELGVAAGGTIRCYPVITRTRGQAALMDHETVLTINSGTDQVWEIDVPVPSPASGTDRSRGYLYVFFQSEVSTGGPFSTQSILDVGRDWVRVASQLNEPILLDVDEAEVSPRLVKYENTATVDAATNTTYYMVEPWDRWPANGDTLQSYGVTYVEVLGYTVIPKKISTYNVALAAQIS